jgi:hypothetical protein
MSYNKAQALVHKPIVTQHVTLVRVEGRFSPDITGRKGRYDGWQGSLLGPRGVGYIIGVSVLIIFLFLVSILKPLRVLSHQLQHSRIKQMSDSLQIVYLNCHHK